MATPTASDLSAFLGPRLSVNTAQANSVLGVVKSLAYSYVRGEGFTSGEPNEEISSVILCAAARLLSHARQTGMSETYGPSSANYTDAPFTWSVAERLTLDRYRVKAL